MKSFKSLMESLAEAWPGTPEYKKKFGSPADDGSEGSRHKIDRSAGITRATRKYDSESGESEEPTKSRDDAAAAPAKRGRGRPPGKYGSYKKKVKESIEILEALETDEEIEEFVFSLDEESFAELEQYLSLDDFSDELELIESLLDEEYLDEGILDSIKKKASDLEDKIKGNFRPKRNDTNMDRVKRVLGKVEDKIKGNFRSKRNDTNMDRIKNAASKAKTHVIRAASKVGLASRFHPALRKEDVESVDEALKGAMHPDAAKVLKHIKPEHHSTYKPYLKQGVYKGNYSDRAAVLSAAEKAGHIKEDAELDEVDEALKHPNHKVLDKNKNNKLDREDFAILRGEKKAPVKEEIGLAEGSGPKEKQHDKYVDRNSPAAQAKVQAAKDRMAAEKKAEAGKKMLAKLKEEVSEEKVADIAAFITKQAKGEA